MTSEVAVIRQETMALEPLCRVDPPPRSSPPMRMTASWCDPQTIDRIQGCGARSAQHQWRARLGFSSPAATGRSHVTSNQVGSAMPRPTGADSRIIDAKCVAPSRRILPSCSRPSRTLRAASRWPEGGPSSDRRCARRRSERAAGTGEWLRWGRTKELEKEAMEKKKIALDNEHPIQGFQPPASTTVPRAPTTGG